ncbi:MAG: MFS transporter [Propionibacteriaceae bacterium]|nr:MFS transporter [Propionibacteriaceae bacterium]
MSENYLENPSIARKVTRSWALWRFGTQPFNSVILTFVFVSIYLTSYRFLSPEVAVSGLLDPTNPNGGFIPCDSAINNATAYCTGLASLSSQWSAWNAVAGLLVLLFAPVLGARAETNGGRKRWLLILTSMLALSQFVLVFVIPDPSWFAFGAITVALGVVIVEIAGVQSNAMLHGISTPENRGRVSGLGWGLGYIGGVVVLLISVTVLQTDWFGLAPDNGLSYRLIGVLTAVWTIVFLIPLARNVPEYRITDAPKVSFFRSYVELVSDMIALHKQSKPTFWFLLASAVYRDGLAGVFAFGGILAAQAFGFSSIEVMIFGLALVTIAGVSTILAGRLDDKFGSRALIIASLSLLVGMALFVFAFAFAGKIILWIGGAFLSAAVGPAQAASRTLLARLTPSTMQGEIFGLYATTGEVTGVLHPAIWTVFVVGFGATMYGVLGLGILLAIGLVLFLLVKIPKDPERHAGFEHLMGWNDKILIGLTVLVFIGTGAIIFGLTGAAYIPGGAAIAAFFTFGAAIWALISFTRGRREIATSGQNGIALARASTWVALVTFAIGIVFTLMQFGIVPLVRLGG